jgi:allantoinase
VSGGVTTLIDMPLNSIPPTTTVENLRIKREAAKRVGVSSDLGFWGGIIPGNEGDLVPMLKEGVKGFKCFLIESGVDEFPHVEEEHLVRACDALEGTDALILFHAELGPHDHELAPGNDSQYSTFLESRPASLELSALELILRLARRYRSLRFHIVHLSTAQALPVIRDARRTGVTNLTVETCFHYLLLRAEDIPANATQFKCCPPIREEANRLAICDAVLDGTIDFVVSDHSPCVAELKRGDFMSAWGGISGLGLGLSLLWTDLGERAGLGRLVELLSTAQARQVKLEGVKGALQEGADADFVVFAPEATFEVTLVSRRYRCELMAGGSEVQKQGVALHRKVVEGGG